MTLIIGLDKSTKKKVKWTILRIVKQNERKQVDTLKPKGIESGYNGSADTMANGQMILGLQMASKVLTLFVMYSY